MKPKIKNKSKRLDIPKRRDKEKSRQKLLHAGIEVFSKLGFEAATTKNIAKKADLNEVMIARYFNNKAGLLKAILVELVKGANVESNARPIAENLQKELSLLMREKCQRYLEQRNLHRISMSRLLVDSSLEEQMEKHVFPVAEKTIIERIQIFQNKGQINSAYSLPMIAKMVQFECVGILTMMCLQKKFDQAMINNLIDSLSNVLANGFRQAP